MGSSLLLYTVQQAVWVVLVFIGVLATSYHAYTMANKYYQFKSQTSMSLAVNDTFDFPALNYGNML
jgi:hypothetical protein